MSFLLNKRLLWEVARRGLAGLLVLTLVCSLSFDLRHHAAHAGQPHAGQPHAGQSHAGQSHASHVTAGTKAALSVQLGHAVQHASVTAGQPHDEHSGGSGFATDCDCCSVSCVSLVIFGDTPSIDAPVPPRSTLPPADSAIPEGLAQSHYRPPIAIL